MNYFTFHLGDYAKKTRHLSWDEDMAYRRMMDAYYLREGPLPADKRAIYRLVVAATKGQREAVDTILAEFFVPVEDGFSNSRCEVELAEWKIKSEKAAESAHRSWEERRKRTHEGNGANANAPAKRTQSDGNAPTSHFPLPNKKGARANGKEGKVERVAVFEGTDAWAAWKATGKRFSAMDIRTPAGIKRGWYFASEFPPQKAVP